ncbi:uncharacterized protein LOC134286265 [Aedes albopictus]|uniref:Reverse transcriptase domain-containing protein n=1 Tax=Aedes albopictus TaxID=7160 RepID=A0ABM1ZYX6_AEDAL
MLLTKCYPRSSFVVCHLKRMSSWEVIKPASSTAGRQRTRSLPYGKSSRNAVNTRSQRITCSSTAQRIMDENGFPGKLTRLIKATMDGVQNCVRVSGELSSSFESRRGLRQGDGLSCLLFNIALEGVVRRAGLNSQGTILTKSGQFVCFADDMDITARTFGTVAELYTHLKREAAKVGLVVNASKTKYMLVGGTEHDRIRLGSNVPIDGNAFDVVEEFVYLRSLLTADNNVSREIRRRIISGSRAYYGLQKKLRSKKIHPPTRAKNDLRWCAGERCVAEKDEPRARYTLRRTQHPEGGQSRKDTVGRACCKNAGQQPCKAGVCN